MEIKKTVLQTILLIFLSNITFAQLTPAFTVDKDPPNYCVGDTVRFSNTTSGSYNNLHWLFGDGNDTYYYENPVYVYNSAGTYKVWLIVFFNDGTKDSVSMDITINQSPQITLSVDQEKQIINASVNDDNVSFYWYFGQTLTGITDSYLNYIESGTYSVVAENNLGCKDSAAVSVIADIINSDSLTINVANNILTPDVKDGINDVLFIENLDSYAHPCMIYIYDRLGRLVYKNENYSNTGGFDGRSSNDGKILDAGTYLFIIKSEGRKTTTGYIDIIR